VISVETLVATAAAGRRARGSRDEGNRGGPRQTSRTGTRRCTRLYRQANNVLYLNIYGSEQSKNQQTSMTKVVVASAND
jgi:hypothetical protein